MALLLTAASVLREPNGIKPEAQRPARQAQGARLLLILYFEISLS